MKRLVELYPEVQMKDLPAGEFSEEERRVLDEVNQRVAGSESLESIIDFLFGSTRSIFPCDRIGVALFSEDTRRISARYARAGYPVVHLNRGYTEDVHGSSLETLLMQGGARVIRDLQAYLAAKPQSHSTTLMVSEGIRSSMTCLLKVEGRPVGMLWRSSKTVDAYDEHQVRLHFAVAERLSQAVEKAYRIEQLQATLHDYHEMLAFISHELKNPLASIVMDAAVLLQGYVGELDPKHREKVGAMHRKALHLISLLREYLDLTRIESGKLRLSLRRGVDFVSEVVLPALEMVESDRARQGMRLVRKFSDEVLSVTCDSELMKIVLINLLENAVKYGRPEGEIRLQIDKLPGSLRVQVWNEGTGFSDLEAPKLFHKFSRLAATAAEQRGTGIGLYTAWRIMQLHQGRISARSEKGQWAEFTFEIPESLTVPVATC